MRLKKLPHPDISYARRFFRFFHETAVVLRLLNVEQGISNDEVLSSLTSAAV